MHYREMLPLFPARGDDDSVAPEDPQTSDLRGSPHDPQIMPPKGMTRAAIEKLVVDRVEEAIAADRVARGDVGGAGGQGGAPPAR
ncbi:hypothetical protein Tco_0892677 [Tanacetum coccineum]|uniref:Uncharacterized protein n=1 Tax=Tanacetum coccineum TaxID=301880 RepID=A0ABQ5C6L2_9ASTR